MKTEQEILAVLDRLPPSGETEYRLMTYENGIEEVILWIIEEISDSGKHE